MTPLVIAFTPNYFVPAAVTLSSILRATACKSARYEVLCMVTEEIPLRQKEMLSEIAGDRMRFEYVSLAGRLKGCYVDPRYSEAASYRLLLPELLPEKDTVIYIDCDVVVRQDLSELYGNLELGDNLLAAVFEAPIEDQASRFIALGCDPEKYFNSGFLVMNLARMREEGTSAKLLEALKVDYLEFPDQDALNQVCKDRVFPLPPVYNGIRTFFIPKYKADFLKIYSEAQWKDVHENGTVHYTGGKPWNLFTVQFGLWWETYFSLPESVRSEWQPSGKILTIYKVYRTAMGRFAIDMAQSVYRRVKSFRSGRV